MMDIIQLGKSSFKVATLKTITKKEAQELYSYLDKRLVASAWDQANPKGKRKPRKKSN
tara:strand:- start:319 stop:492 length:174 start_codon:yes stop_codon:yes gene_type:complete